MCVCVCGGGGQKDYGSLQIIIALKKKKGYDLLGGHNCPRVSDLVSPMNRRQKCFQVQHWMISLRSSRNSDFQPQ